MATLESHGNGILGNFAFVLVMFCAIDKFARVKIQDCQMVQQESPPAVRYLTPATASVRYLPSLTSEDTNALS